MDKIFRVELFSNKRRRNGVMKRHRRLQQQDDGEEFAGFIDWFLPLMSLEFFESILAA